MTARLSVGHFSIFGLVFFVLKSLLGIARRWSREKFAILTLKPRSHDVIIFILPHEKFLQFGCLRTVAFQLNLKYLHVKITNLLWVVV